MRYTCVVFGVILLIFAVWGCHKASPSEKDRDRSTDSATQTEWSDTSTAMDTQTADMDSETVDSSTMDTQTSVDDTDSRTVDTGTSTAEDSDTRDTVTVSDNVSDTKRGTIRCRPGSTVIAEGFL